MERTVVNLAEAKARLSELTELAAAGEEVVITKHGKPVAALSRPRKSRKPVDQDALRRLTTRLPREKEAAGEFLRRVRDDARY